MKNRTIVFTVGKIRRLFAFVIGSIFAVEILVMFILTNIPPFSPWLTIAFDTILLSLLIFPILYLGFYRPLIDLAIEQTSSMERIKIFEQTIMSLNSSVNIADMNDNVILVNPAFCRLYGYTEHELLGVNSSIFWSARNPKEVMEQILPATLQGGWKGELVNRKKDGSEFVITLSTSVIKNEAGENIALVGTGEDITERKQKELELRVTYEITQCVAATSNLSDLLHEIHRVLKDVLYAENFFVAIHDPSTGLFSFPYFVDQFDSVPEPMTMDKSSSAYVFRNNSAFLFTQSDFDVLVEKDEIELIGTPSPSWLGVPLRVPNKTIGVMVVQHYQKENVYSEQDVQFFETVGHHIAVAIERKWAEEALRESEEMFRKLFNESTDPILLLDDSGFFSCNPSTVSLLGYGTTREVLNKKPWELSPERQPDGQRSADKAKQMIETAIEKGYHRFEWMHTRADGSDLPVEVMLTPVTLNGKQFLYTIWRDITERKRVQAERELLITELQEALEQIKTLKGIVPICVRCKKIRDDKGYWEQVDAYVTKHTEAQFSHSICPDCTREYLRQLPGINDHKI